MDSVRELKVLLHKLVSDIWVVGVSRQQIARLLFSLAAQKMESDSDSSKRGGVTEKWSIQEEAVLCGGLQHVSC